MTVRKTGGVSTLAVVDGVKAALPDIKRLMPPGVDIKAIFDQSVFVKASLNSVLMGGLMAAGLTALMILLFLGNWRLTLIILATIPLAIITAVLVIYVDGQTLNTMTLGGFALAVGILVDNGTVVIENIERHLHEGDRPDAKRSSSAAAKWRCRPCSRRSAICIVFVPVFLLQGTAKYLFSPLSLSVCVSLIASLGLSFTLVPVLFAFLMRSSVEGHGGHAPARTRPRRRFDPLAVFGAIHRGFEARLQPLARGLSQRRGLLRRARRRHERVLSRLLACLARPVPAARPRISFPPVDAGQMRLHVRAPPATRLEETQRDFAEVERAIREIVGADQIDVILDNIGLPYSGINIALSDSATVGPMDGEILISLKEKHRRRPRTRRPAHGIAAAFPDLQFFFQPADIVNQVLNFGQPAPIDIRISGPDSGAAYALAQKIAHELKSVPGVVDSHVFQVPDAPALTIDVDRTLANQLGLDEAQVAKNVLVSANSSAQTVPNFWVMLGILSAASGTTTEALMLQMMMQNQSLATYIDLTRTDTIAGVEFLVSEGLLTSTRANQILTNPPSSTEIYKG